MAKIESKEIVVKAIGAVDDRFLKEFGIKIEEPSGNLREFSSRSRVVLTRRGMGNKVIPGEKRIVG